MGPGEKFCNQAFDANLVATLGKAKNNLLVYNVEISFAYFAAFSQINEGLYSVKAKWQGLLQPILYFSVVFYTDLGTGFFEEPQGIFEASSTNCLPLTAFFSSKSC